MNDSYFFMIYGLGYGSMCMIHHHDVNTKNPKIRIEILNPLKAEIEYYD